MFHLLGFDWIAENIEFVQKRNRNLKMIFFIPNSIKRAVLTRSFHFYSVVVPIRRAIVRIRNEHRETKPRNE